MQSDGQINSSKEMVQQDNVLDRNVFKNSNARISNGFGAMFFNLRDPTFLMTNEPIKQDISQSKLIIATIILLVGVALGILAWYIWLTFMCITVVTYVFYLIVSIRHSKIRPYLASAELYDDYHQKYTKMRQGAGYFTFWIECYHTKYEQAEIGGYTHKFVTHTATQTFDVAATFDESGQIGSIKDVNDLVFINYLKRFYFTDDISQQRFIHAFSNFVSRHRRDSHQTYTHQFNFEGYEELAAFTALNSAGKSQTLFYVFTLMGLGLIYACIIELFIARYDVGILKRLTI